MDMISAIQNGDKRIAAKLISMLENHHPEATAILQSAQPALRKANVIGITGAPGAGKSTLTDQLAKSLLQRKRKVGVIAVDPSSPITGGAFLGDRIRMSDLNSEPDVFIRSMATRGALGGISKAVAGAIRVMEIYGAETIFVETVGIGQSEIDVANLAATVVFVVVPGMGDDIQAEKAGILEVSDIIAVNKADHEDTNRTIQQLTSMMGLKMRLHPETSGAENWEAQIIPTVATTGEGIAELLEAIEAHQTWLSGVVRRPESDEKKIKEEILTALRDKFESEFLEFNNETEALPKSINQILKEKVELKQESVKVFEEFIKWRT